MIILHLLAFFAAAFAVAYYFRSSLPETIPLVFCGLALILYPLAFFRALGLIDVIAIALCLAVLIYFYVQYQRLGGKEFWHRCRPILGDLRFWAFLGVAVVMICLVQFRQVLEWDAYNFWAPDIKSLFYRNGFAGQYCNVSPGFGDYPPIMQLLLWWFLHLGGAWQEQTLFVGYFLFGASLLFALAGKFIRSNRFWTFPLAVGLGFVVLLLPGLVDTSWYRSLYMDPVMALVFGSMLGLAVGDNPNDRRQREISFFLLALFLTLMKSIGFLWALFAIVFYFLWHHRSRSGRSFAAITLAGVAGVYGSWALFCKLTERTTTLTVSLAPTLGSRIRELLGGTLLASGHNAAFLSSFLKAFFTESVHLGATALPGLTPFFTVLLILGSFALLGRAGLLNPKECRKLLIYAAAVLGFTYLMLLTAHLTIFYEETAYLEPAKMAEQMTRYSSPATLGLLMLAGTVLTRKRRLKNIFPSPTLLKAVAVFLILAGTCWGTVMDGFIAGHDRLNESRITLREQRLAEYGTYIAAASAISVDDPRARVLLCTATAEDFELKAPVIAYAVSPISMMALSLPSGDNAATVIASLQTAHAGYLYVTRCDGETGKSLGKYTKGGTFVTDTLYQVTYRDHGDPLFSTAR